MKRLPVVATIVVGLCIALMIALGLWQLQRKAEKEALLAQYAANITLPPIAFPTNPVDDSLLFRKSHGFCLEPVGWTVRSGRNAKGGTGWRQIARCRTGAEGPGMTVQVGVSSQPDSKPAWKGGTVSGYITHAPDDQPLIMSLIGPMTGWAHPKILMLVADTPAPGLSANPAPDLSAVPNNHLAYAVQWFIFAGLAGIIYAIAVRRRMVAPPPPRPLVGKPMRYISTRGNAPVLDFQAVTLAGLASDGGLYLPESWPRLAPEQIAAMRGLSYVDTAVAVMAPFVEGTLTPAELKALCTEAYGRFSHAAVTPLVQLDGAHWLLELFHGPTLAFKDVALQLLGLLFERFLRGSDKQLTVVGATSGDTGSAAIDALAGRAGVDVFMLHPKGRVSDVQRRQMTTVLSPNIHNIAIDGSFDDAQALVKAMFNDAAFSGRFALSAVNSINWARLMAQIVYYFYAAVRLGAPERPVAFSVPTGNFGDVFAGYVAAKMGLPIAKLIVATNVNDILHRALSQGDYSQGTVVPTPSPSMDIQVSSNFERLLFDLGGRDGGALGEQMRGFETSKAMRLTNAQRDGASALFASDRIDLDDMALAMRWACDGRGR